MVYLLLQIFIHSMMTTSYPNETIPWSHFPSKIHYEKLTLRLAIILVYQLDPNRLTTLYFNALFALAMLMFVGQRLGRALTFDRSIHIL